MKTWINSPPCQKRTQCYACRCDENFQAQLAEYFEMPAGWPACPHGVTLDTLPEPLPGLPAWYYIREEFCGACEDECMMKKLSGCQRRARLKRPAMSCPNEHWASPTEHDNGL